jgi:hypothetical protein
MTTGTVALLGGTGHEGLGLALRLARFHHSVVIGSRNAERAAHAAAHVSGQVPGAQIRGATNAVAVTGAEVVFITLPFRALGPVLEEVYEPLVGKLVIDVVNPLAWHAGRAGVRPVPEGSAAEYIRSRLPRSRVVSALKTNGAEALARTDAAIEGDVLICGDDPEAKAVATGILSGIGGRVVDLGPLDRARELEQVTALLLNLNHICGAVTSVRIVGLPGEDHGKERSSC